MSLVVQGIGKVMSTAVLISFKNSSASSAASKNEKSLARKQVEPTLHLRRNSKGNSDEGHLVHSVNAGEMIKRRQGSVAAILV